MSKYGKSVKNSALSATDQTCLKKWFPVIGSKSLAVSVCVEAKLCVISLIPALHVTLKDLGTGTFPSAKFKSRHEEWTLHVYFTFAVAVPTTSCGVGRLPMLRRGPGSWVHRKDVPLSRSYEMFCCDSNTGFHPVSAHAAVRTLPQPSGAQV